MEKTRIIKRTTRADGSIEELPVELNRIPESFDEISKSKQKKKTNGDVSVTSTTFVDISGASITVTLSETVKLYISVLAYGKAATGESLRLTLDLDGSNMGGSGGLAVTESDKAGSISAVGLSNALAPGAHTVKVQAKVSGGTGTLFASAASCPLVLAVRIVEGDQS